MAAMGLLGLGFTKAESKELQEQIMLAKRAGVPILPQDLGQTVRDSDNAAPYFVQAIELSNQSLKSQTEQFLNSIKNETDATYTGPAEKGYPYLPALQPIVQQLRQAAQKPQLDFHRDWNLGPKLKLSEEFDLFRLSKLLLVDADHRLNVGDTDGAWSELNDAAKVAGLSSTEPTALSASAGSMQQVSVEQEALRFLNKLGPRADSEQRIAEVVASLGPVPSIKHALAGEIVLEQAIIGHAQETFAKSINPANVPGIVKLAHFAAVRDAMQAANLQYWRELYGRIPNDPTDAMSASDALRQGDATIRHTNDWRLGFTREATPSFLMVAEAVGRQVAERRALVALATYMTRESKGTITDWSLGRPTDLVDPFSGGPLKVIQKPHGGIIVYSVGVNGIDDGGSPTDDIVAAYPIEKG